MNGDRPSAHGALLGEILAAIADLGERDSPVPLGERCATCAFRKGTTPNQTAGTGTIALNCVLGIDKDRFACHYGMKDGTPQRICVGYIAARMAPFSLVKEAMSFLYEEIAKVGDNADPVRESFDAWLGEIDPDGKMDVYQIARAHLRTAQGKVSA